MQVALLERKGGATISEMAAALYWQEHTVRGVMSGALTKKFGLVIVSETCLFLCRSDISRQVPPHFD